MKIITIWVLMFCLCSGQFPTFGTFPKFKQLEVYNPIDANTTYFWRADMGTTDSGDSLSAWNDQIGTFHFLQATGADQPTFNDDSVAVYFKSANTEFMATASSPTMNYSTFSIDMYLIVGNKDTAQTILTEYQASTSLWQIATNATGAGNITFGATLASVSIQSHSVASSAYTAGKRTCFTVAVLAGTSIAWYFNNVAASVTTTTNLNQEFNNTGTLRLGKLNTTAYFRGYIWAIRISNKTRTQTEHADFYNWCQETF